MATKLLADIFQDGMVLPINKAFHLGGFAQPRADVRVEFAGESFTVQADSAGHWRVTLPSYGEQSLDKLVVASGSSEQTLHDLHFGRVLLLSGQSNIEYRLKDDAEFAQAQADLMAGKYPDLYYYNCPQVDYRDPETGEVKPEGLKAEKWQAVTAEKAGDMSAIGYYCLVKMHELDPDQIYAAVDCFKGGTSASNWLPVDLLKADAEINEAFIKPYEEAVSGKTWADFDAETAKWQDAVDQHNRDLDLYLNQHPESSLSQAKNIVGHTPWPPPMRPDSYLRPGALYETMVSQIQDMTVSDWVWYQGENDTDRPKYYSNLLSSLIKTWRKLFDDPSLPIKIMQLPGYDDQPENSIAMIRQTQLEMTRQMPYADLVSIADQGERHNIHPTHKRTCGYRLGECLSGQFYPSTPQSRDFCLKDNQLSFRVTNAASVIALPGSAQQFAYQLADQSWHQYEGNVEVTGQRVTLTMPADVQALRYGYANYPELAFYNEKGYPLSPFEQKL